MLTELEILDFLKESNAIEREYSEKALDDALLAWKYMMKREVLFEKDILELHRLLMQSLRPDIAGKYRTSAVSIGGQIKKYFGLEVIRSLMSDFINLMIESYKLETTNEKEVSCKNAHIFFENCHSFEDGNGRLGRMLYNWHRLKLGLPLHIIHEGTEQQSYYQWFVNNSDEKYTK